MPTPRLCLNMIVRNESERIIRALDSVKDYVHAVAVLDTGSTDNTVELIKAWGGQHNIPTACGSGVFIDFSQARNQALDLGGAWCRHHKCDYLLLMDADMTLVVEDQRAFEHLGDPAYEMVQKAGGVSYNNLRLLSVGCPARYYGVTHEYLDAGGATLQGAHFIDYADGSNRGEKYSRDIRLLTEDLTRDPDNPRTWFYLANTYRDKGQFPEAVDAYRKRIALGGWDEEVWQAQVHLAGCLKEQGIDDAWVFNALKGYEMRPQRAEPLHDIAKFFRERGEAATALLFAEAGLGMSRPDDRLFVADWVYEWGFREEFAISGYYVSDKREEAFKINNSLALDASIPGPNRYRARRDAVFFLPKLKDVCPSARFKQIECDVDDGYVAMNPCVTRKPSGPLEVLVRTVNYRIDEHGRYMIGPQQCGDAPIDTRNILVQLDTQLNSTHQSPVVWDRPEPKFPLVTGLEDMRIFWHHGQRRFYANVRERFDHGQCVQHHGQLEPRAGTTEVVAAIPISDGATTEKNWVPFQWEGPSQEIVYRLDTLGTLEHHVATFEKYKRHGMAIENISGSSQWIPFASGMLSIVHESITHPSHGKRVYQHRFAWTDTAFGSLRLSLPFVFLDVQIEFCAGLADDGSKLVASFGERDEKAWLVSLNYADVRCALGW